MLSDVRRVAILVVLLGTALLAFPHAATAQSGTERITDYAVDIREPDGTLAVEEKIVYDFAAARITASSATSYARTFRRPPRSPLRCQSLECRRRRDADGVRLSDEGSFRRMRVGDPNARSPATTRTRSTTRCGRTGVPGSTAVLGRDRPPVDRAYRARQCRQGAGRHHQVTCFAGPGALRAPGIGVGSTAVFGHTALGRRENDRRRREGRHPAQPKPLLDKRRTLEGPFAVSSRTLGARPLGGARHRR
jgi:hypothetical protein